MFMSSLSDELTHLQENSKTDALVGFRQPYWCPSKGHQDGHSINFLLNTSNTHLPITLEQNAFGLQTLAQKCSLIKFGIEICYLLLLNFDMTSVKTTNRF